MVGREITIYTYIYGSNKVCVYIWFWPTLPFCWGLMSEAVR